MLKNAYLLCLALVFLNKTSALSTTQGSRGYINLNWIDSPGAGRMRGESFEIEMR